MTRSRAGERGLTLLEVLVALALVAMTLAAAFHLSATALAGSARSERVTLALLAAESRLAALGVEEPLRAGRTGGGLDGGFRWTADVRPYEGLPPATLGRLPVRAYEVAVSVRWGDDEAEAVTLQTVKLRPRRRDDP